jgi:uncharacterized membrane protein
MRLILILAFCIIGFVAAAQRADASLTACNHTGEKIVIAWFVDNQGIPETKGWWMIQAGQCKELIYNDISGYDAIGYYAFSTSPRQWFSGRYWGGDSKTGWNLCINFSHTQPFHYLNGEQSCATKRLYRPLAIPRGASSHTFTLEPG